jgi:hypothetical protein
MSYSMIDISEECVTTIFKCQISQARIWKWPFRTQDGEKKTGSRPVSRKQMPFALVQGTGCARCSLEFYVFQKSIFGNTVRRVRRCTCSSKKSQEVHLSPQGKQEHSPFLARKVKVCICTNKKS